jgi:hypothetical protein
MTESGRRPPLKFLHPAESLNSLKLEVLSKLSTEALVHSLQPGQAAALKARPDGTILDGHHRIHILKSRQVDVDALPRETIVRESEGTDK